MYGWVSADILNESTPPPPQLPYLPRGQGERERAYNGAFNGTHYSASDLHPANCVSECHLKTKFHKGRAGPLAGELQNVRVSMFYFPYNGLDKAFRLDG